MADVRDELYALNRDEITAALGRAVPPSTRRAWVTRGARGPDGRLVRLGAVRLGSQWVTSPRRVGEFLAALNAPPPIAQ